MVELTASQREALDLAKHISVTANAGSGKTRVLVERYVESVASGIDVENILCLTFTEKAALELRQRIVERISAEVAESYRHHSDTERSRSLKHASGKMLEANISTIHSFCSQVLREFPIEAGVDANFKVLEEFDAASLKETACDEAIRTSLVAEKSGGGEHPIHDLLVRIGYRRTLGILLSLLDNREKIEHLGVIGKPVLLHAEKIHNDWIGISRRIESIIENSFDLQKSSELGDAILAIKGVNARTNPGLSEVHDAVAKILSSLLTNDGTVRKKLKMQAGIAGLSREASGVMALAFSSTKDAERTNTKPDDYIHILGVLIGLYEQSAAIYSRKKNSMGALDFDDLQIGVMKLLRANATVRETLVSRFQHIMLDEFQDTNFLQYDIFRSILNDFTGGARLFVVGDPKQSIYRFRNAQVEVSIKTEKELSALPDGKSVSLSESFRMNTSIASFVNGVFSTAMTTTVSPDIAGVVGSVSYNALVAHRAGEPDEGVEIFFPSAGQDGGEDIDERGGTSILDTNEMQAAFTAARIRRMVDGKEKRRDVKSAEEQKEIAFGDVAILLRSRSKLSVLEEAMNRYKVPYTVSSGIGFYSSQEVYDLTAYLSFLLDNDSDIHLLTILRSPFFGISENELFDMSFSAGRTLFERLKTFAPSAKGTLETRYAVSVLEEEINLAHRLTIPQLLDRILSRTGWLGAYAQSPTASQRLANLRKLIAIAREFEGRGFNNLYDFVERIKYLKKAAREGQAAAEEGVDAVRIMTVHAAKGLEFPVVFIPFCDSKTNHGDDIVINENVGVLPIIGGEFPPELNIYRKLEITNEQAETVRLFYVACTRAMDKLVLTSNVKKSESRSGINSFSDILAKTLDLSTVPQTGYYDLPGVRVIVHHELPDVKVVAREKRAVVRVLGEMFVGPLPAAIDGEMYSATLLQTFKLCPTKYFLRYLLGMPVPEEKRSRSDEFDFTDTIRATMKGEIIHEVLQNIVSSGKTSEAEIRNAASHSILSRLSDTGGVEDIESLTGTVVENARNAVKTLEKITAGGTKFFEQTITRRFGNDFLTGTLDLLVQDDGGYHIYDYKTNKLDRSAEEIFADYDVQMKFYASLCRQLDPNQKDFDATIIFTREAGKYLTKKYSKAEIENFERETSSMIKEIKKIESPSGFLPGLRDNSLPTRTPHCRECDYFVGEGKKECMLGKSH